MAEFKLSDELASELEARARDAGHSVEQLLATWLERPAMERMFEVSRDIWCVTGFDGSIRRVNPAAETILGYAEAELLNTDFLTLIHPDDREAAREEAAKLASGVPTDRFQDRIRHKDGSYKWMEWTAYPFLEQGVVYAIGRDITPRKQREAEIRLQGQLLDAVGQAVMATDLDGTIFYWNDAAERLYGWPAEAVIGRDILEITPADASKQQARDIMSRLRAGESWTGEFEVRRRDGSTFPAMVTDMPIHDEDGKLIGIVGVSEDITERKAMEEALRESEELHRITLTSISDAIFITDGSGQFTYICPNAYKIFVYSVDEMRALGNIAALLGDGVFDPRELDEAGELRNIERTITDKSGQRHTLLVNVKRVAIRGGTVLYTCRDITERKETGEILRKQALIFENLTDAIIITDLERGIIDWNPAAERMFGYTKEEALGKTASIVQHPDKYEQFGREIAESIQREGRWFGAVNYIRKDGTEGICETLVVPLRDEHGKPIARVGVNRDITQRKQAEQALQASEQLFRTLTESSLAGIYIIQDRKFQYVNPALAHTFGYDSPDEVLDGLGPTDLTHPDDRDPVEENVRQRVEGEVESIQYAFRGLRKDGQTIHCEVMGRRVDYQGHPAVMGTLLDVTERKNAEATLQRYSNRLEVLHEIDRAILAAESPQSIAQAVLARIDQLVPCQRASVTTYDFETGEVVVIASHGMGGSRWMPGERLPMMELNAPPEGQRRGEVYVMNHLRYSPYRGDRALYARGIHAYVSAPLMLRGKLIGALNLGADEPDVFSTEDIRIAREIAIQLALAIESARLLEIERQRSAELEALRQASLRLTSHLELDAVLGTIVEHALRLVRAYDAHIFLYDGDEVTFGAAYWEGKHRGKPYANPRPEGLTYTVARTGRRIVVSDVNSHPLFEHWQWGGAIIGFPLKIGDRVNGVMTMAFEEPHTFDQSMLHILQLLADQAAIAIENAKLYEQVHGHAERLEQRVAERTAELRHTKERVEAILNNSSDAIILTHMDGRVQQVNPAFSAMFGYTADEIMRQSLTSLVPPAQGNALRRVLGMLADDHRPQRIEITARRKDGSTFDTDMALSPIADEGERARGIVCSLRDITQRKQMEAELREALAKERELNELKTRFTSMMSHEFRTPLTSIQLSADMLGMYYDRMAEERKRVHLDRIRSQIKNIIVMLDDALAVTRAEAVGLEFNPAPFDLETFCRDMAEEFQVGVADTHRIVFSSTGECGDAAMDERLVRHIVTNLLSNAIKYSPGGGTVQLELRCEGGQAVIRIEDDGIGIPEADQQRVFETFHRARNVGNISGTGLGLAVVKRAVEAHGGAITYESREDQGTVFSVTLPLTI